MLVIIPKDNDTLDEFIACAIIESIPRFYKCAFARVSDIEPIEEHINIYSTAAYNPDRLSFGYETPQFNEKHDNGLSMKTSGLVWRHFGKIYITKHGYGNGYWKYLDDIIAHAVNDEQTTDTSLQHIKEMVNILNRSYDEIHRHVLWFTILNHTKEWLLNKCRVE